MPLASKTHMTNSSTFLFIAGLQRTAKPKFIQIDRVHMCVTKAHVHRTQPTASLNVQVALNGRKKNLGCDFIFADSMQPQNTI